MFDKHCHNTASENQHNQHGKYDQQMRLKTDFPQQSCTKPFTRKKGSQKHFSKKYQTFTKDTHTKITQTTAITKSI